MSHANSSLLATYNALVDPNLKCYFSNERVRTHLKNSGLISRRGEIIPENEYRARLARRDHKQSVRQMLAENIVHRAIDMERARQAELRQKYEFDCKKELVKQIQLSRKNRTCPSISAATDKDRANRELTDQSWHEAKHSSVFLDAEDVKEFEGKYQRLSRVQSAKVYRSHQMNSQLKTENRRRLARPRSSHISWTKHGKQSTLSTKNLDKTSCEITMVYYGTNIKLDQDYSALESIDEILVMQQHCGGENVIVYKGNLKAGDTFTFESRRHPDYPLGLSFSVKGLFDSRVSACCEYRHRHGIRLGGERGHFAILSVQGSKPCLRCRFKQQLRFNEYDQANGDASSSINDEETPVIVSLREKDETMNIRVPLIKIPISHSINSNKSDSNPLDNVKTKLISNQERSSADTTNRQSQSSRERKDSSTSTSDKVRRKTNVVNRKDDLFVNDDLTSSTSDSDTESSTKTWQIIFHTSNIPMGSLHLPVHYQSGGKLRFSFVGKMADLETEVDSIELNEFPQCFKSGRQDSFATKLKNIGLPQKIRLILQVDNEEELDLKWHLDHIELIDPETQLHFKFLSQRWIRANEYYIFDITDSPRRLSTRNSSLSTNNSKISLDSKKQNKRQVAQQEENKCSNRKVSRSSSSNKLDASKEQKSLSKMNSPASEELTRSTMTLIPCRLVVHASNSGDGEFNALADTRIFVRFDMQENEYELVEPQTKSCPSFQSGQVKTFDIEISVTQIEKLSSLTLGYINSDITAIKWQIEKLVLVNKVSQEEATFYCEQALVRNDLDFVAKQRFVKQTARRHSSSSSSSSASETVSLANCVQQTEDQQRISMKHQLSTEQDDPVNSIESHKSAEVEARPKTRRGRDDPVATRQGDKQLITDPNESVDVWRPASQTNRYDKNYSSDEFVDQEKCDQQSSRKENGRTRSPTDSDDD